MAKSKRLTKSLRDDIVTAVLNKTFGKRVEKHGKRKGVIYRELVDKLIPADFKEILKSGTINPEWFPDTCGIRIHVVTENQSTYLDFYGASMRIPNTLLRAYNNNRLYVDYNDLHPESQALIKGWQDEEENISKEKTQLEKATMEVLNSVSTVKQLKELWPEVENYFKLEESTAYPLMCVNTAGLNNMIQQFRAE